jgi:hypothetical protein
LEGSFGFVRVELGRNPSDRGNLSDRHVLDHSADATNALISVTSRTGRSRSQLTSRGTSAEMYPSSARYHTTAGMVAIGHSRYHYFGRFTYAAARCKSIFGNADIAAVVVER